MNVSVKCAASCTVECCIVCSFVMCAVDAIGDNHIVETYPGIGLVSILHVENNVPVFAPFVERTLSMGIVLDALTAVLSMCFWLN